MTVTRNPANSVSPNETSPCKEVTGNACIPTREALLAHESIALTYAYTCNVTPGQVSIDDLPGIFGVPSLHDHQAEAIEAACSGENVVVVAPTGGGKSLGFWGAGLIRGGLTLVISPLRSLIADQFRRLQELGIPVRIWNSDVTDAYKDRTLAMLNDGWQGFLYTTPESLKGRELSSHLIGRVDLAVVDEAHCCLTERGFRISYGWLGKTIDRLQPAVRFACTATLAGSDLQQLTKTLHLGRPRLITVSVARSNLSIAIVERSTAELSNILNRHTDESGIIFAATVATAQNLYDKLNSQGRNVTLYHGRLSAKAKKQSQSDFMSGERLVAIATDAFILGIDKSNIRFIAHYDPPKDIEAWVQGFGRAGRDGLPAAIYGCFRAAEQGRRSRAFLIRSTYPPVCNLEAVWEYLRSAPFRDETASAIGESVLGRNGKYSGSAITTTLRRFGLADADINPQDKRKRLYRARGDFNGVDWSAYEGERKQADQRFAQLCELVRLPDSEIPGAIDAYFTRQSVTSKHGRMNEDQPGSHRAAAKSSPFPASAPIRDGDGCSPIYTHAAENATRSDRKDGQQ